MIKSGWGARLVLFLGMLILAIPSPVRAEVESRIFVVLSEPGQAYRDVADAFASTVARKYPVQVNLVDEFQAADAQRLDSTGNLIVPIGVKAMRWVYGVRPARASILSLMVPQATAMAIAGNAGMAGRESAVYIDQPLSRSVAFIRLLLPQAERIGLILSDETSANLPAYRQEMARNRLGLVVETVSSSLGVPRALQDLLPKVDVFLMLPDSKVVNENTVRHILLASYRQQIPVIGFSRGLTNAGAVAAVVSDPAAIGHEGGQLARLWNPATGSIPAPRYASEYALVINHQVARSLGVEFPEDGQELIRWRKAIE
jgi:putative ABC transport system substrate-binding protein